MIHKIKALYDEGKGFSSCPTEPPGRKRCKIYLDFFTSPYQKFLDFVILHNEVKFRKKATTPVVLKNFISKLQKQLQIWAHANPKYNGQKR